MSKADVSNTPIRSRGAVLAGKAVRSKSVKKKNLVKKHTTKTADREIAEKRANAYSDMEPHVCDLVSMGTLAMDQFDKDQGLFIFAVRKLEDMLIEFKTHYYAEEFPV